MLKNKELNAIRSKLDACVLANNTKINDVELDYTDFGKKYDLSPENCGIYGGCGNMRFVPFTEINPDILKKYNITAQEYKKIQKKLDCLSFGKCSWCG